MKTLVKLKPKQRMQKDFFVFDTETKIYENGLYKYGLRARPDSFCFGVVYGFNFTRVITSVDEFKKEFQKEKYKGKVVFAHNAEYDLNVIYGNIYELDPKAIFNGKFISATNGNCSFADSMNIYSYSVRNIGKFLGLEKLVLNISESGTTTRFHYTPQDEQYCIRDCQVVYDALFDIFETVCDIKITQASLSMTYYRRFFQPYHIDYNEKLQKFFYLSYFGGRTEAFKIGKTNAKVIDINSMYPYAMKYAKFPNPKHLKRIENPKKSRTLHYINNYEGMASVTVNHKDHYFGHLPYRYNNKLCFPTGTFSGEWNFNELRYAINCGVVEIVSCEFIVYSAGQKSIFVEYIDELYEVKRTAPNDLIKNRTKLFLNSLYGKFAQRIDKDFEYVKDINDKIDYIDELQRKGIYLDIQLFSEDRNDCFLVKKSAISKHLNYTIPSFASYITSFSRVMLLKELKENYESNHVPVYCDTDSIFLEQPPTIIDSDKLGEWKLEDKIITEIRGLKNYSYIKKDGVQVDSIKGVPRNAKEVSKGVFKYQNLVKTKEGLVRQMAAGILIDRIKVMRHKYDKRIVDKKGETKPIKL